MSVTEPRRRGHREEQSHPVARGCWAEPFSTRQSGRRDQTRNGVSAALTGPLHSPSTSQVHQKSELSKTKWDGPNDHPAVAFCFTDPP